VRVDQLEHRGRVAQRHPLDLGAAQRDHRAPVAVVDRVDGVQPEAGASQRSRAVGVPPRWMWPSTVVRASLPVRFSISFSSICPMPPSRTCPNESSSPSASTIVPSAGVAPSETTMIVRVVALEPGLDVGADLLDVERHLRDEDDVGTARHARVQRDPAGVPAHDLDDQRAVVRLGGGVQPVDRLHRDVDRGVEAEGEVGGVEVVVDRLRTPTT
jgi:hypothetical protein